MDYILDMGWGEALAIATGRRPARRWPTGGIASFVRRYNIEAIAANRGEGDLLDYRSALKYILGLTNYEKSLKELYSPGNVDLERVRVLLRRLGSPETGLKIVHIAGTKGKGSTAAMISSVLQKAGYRVGLFTSPHLHTFRERVQIDGQPISGEDFASAIERVKPHVEDLNATGEHGYITTFEALTAMALLHFADKGRGSPGLRGRGGAAGWTPPT